VTKLITPRELFSPIFLKTSSLFHASGLDNQFPVVRREELGCRSIARSRKPPTRRKHLGDICYTSRGIAHFVSNFVVMATWVLWG